MKYLFLIFTLFLTACSDEKTGEEFYLSYKTVDDKASFFDKAKLDEIKFKERINDVIEWCDADKKRYFKNEICRDAKKENKPIKSESAKKILTDGYISKF